MNHDVQERVNVPREEKQGQPRSANGMGFIDRPSLAVVKVQSSPPVGQSLPSGGCLGAVVLFRGRSYYKSGIYTVKTVSC